MTTDVREEWLMEALSECSRKLHEIENSFTTSKWLYFDGSRARCRRLLFTGGRDVYEEVKPGLFYLCDDVFDSHECLQ